MKFKIKIVSLIYLLLLSTIVARAAVTKNKGDDAGTITGTVTDKADGKPIIGATVSIPDLRRGAITDVNGHYTLDNLPKGIYLVQVTYVGYASFNQRVDFTKAATLDVQLSVSSIETGEVVNTGVSKATEIKRNPVPMVAVGKT